MVTPVVDVWPLVETRCGHCRAFPCVCRLWTTSRPCACGRSVHANQDDPALGVARHNESPEHQAWRTRCES